MTEEVRTPETEEPGSEKPPSHPTPEPTDDHISPEPGESRNRLTCDQWPGPVPVDHNSIIEPLLLARLNPGDVVIELCDDDGVRAAFEVDAMTAETIHARLTDRGRHDAESISVSLHWTWTTGTRIRHEMWAFRNMLGGAR